MKKVVLTLLVASVFSSCSQDELVNTITPKTITFGNVFVEKATRANIDPTLTADNLKEFYVYGNVFGNNNKVSLYKGDKVWHENDEWECGVTQYWVPDCEYDFVAVTGKELDNYPVVIDTKDANNDETGLPVSIKYNVESQHDLLYAKNDVKTNVSGEPTQGVDNNKAVNFSFEHLLSKVQFTFINEFPENSGVVLKVSDIKITNAVKEAIYTVGEETPWENSGDENNVTNLDFGETEDIPAGKVNGKVSSQKCVLIPGEQEFNILIKITHANIGSSSTKTINTESIKLEVGQFYNFIAVLNADNVEGIVPITFNITKDNDWGVDDDKNVDY